MEPTAPTEPAAEAYPGSGYVNPTVGPDGQPLAPGEQFEALRQIPAWVERALQPGTPEYEQRRALAAQMAETGGESLAPPVGRAEDYVIPYGADADPEQWGPDERALDANLRGWLREAGFNPQEGSEFAKYANDRAQEIAAMNDSARAGMAAQTETQLRAVWGDAYDANIALCRRFVGEVEQKQPGLRAFLEESGLTNDALTVKRVHWLARLRYG